MLHIHRDRMEGDMFAKRYIRLDPADRGSFVSVFFVHPKSCQAPLNKSNRGPMAVDTVSFFDYWTGPPPIGVRQCLKNSSHKRDLYSAIQHPAPPFVCHTITSTMAFPGCPSRRGIDSPQQNPWCPRLQSRCGSSRPARNNEERSSMILFRSQESFGCPW